MLVFRGFRVDFCCSFALLCRSVLVIAWESAFCRGTSRGRGLLKIFGRYQVLAIFARCERSYTFLLTRKSDAQGRLAMAANVLESWPAAFTDPTSLFWNYRNVKQSDPEETDVPQKEYVYRRGKRQRCELSSVVWTRAKSLRSSRVLQLVGCTRSRVGECASRGNRLGLESSQPLYFGDPITHR